jgi:hypothetical protein
VNLSVAAAQRWRDAAAAVVHAMSKTTEGNMHLKGHLFGYGGITVVKGTEFLRFDLMIRHI